MTIGIPAAVFKLARTAFRKRLGITNTAQRVPVHGTRSRPGSLPAARKRTVALGSITLIFDLTLITDALAPDH